MYENIEAQRSHLSGLLKVAQLDSGSHSYSSKFNCIPAALHIWLIFHQTEIRWGFTTKRCQSWNSKTDWPDSKLGFFFPPRYHPVLLTNPKKQMNNKNSLPNLFFPHIPTGKGFILRRPRQLKEIEDFINVRQRMTLNLTLSICRWELEKKICIKLR